MKSFEAHVGGWKVQHLLTLTANQDHRSN